GGDPPVGDRTAQLEARPQVRERHRAHASNPAHDLPVARRAGARSDPAQRPRGPLDRQLGWCTLGHRHYLVGGGAVLYGRRPISSPPSVVVGRSKALKRLAIGKRVHLYLYTAPKP